MTTPVMPADITTASAEVFGYDDGEPVHRLTIRSRSGAEAKILTWGAVIQDLVIPLGGGRHQRVVLGFPEFEPYPVHSPYFGAVVGRYANRIAGGRFTLGGKDYQLDRNEHGSQTLHGGSGGFSQRMWSIAGQDDSSVTLELRSPDGDQGFPGNLTARCSYRFTGDATLVFEASAESDCPTIASMAQHSYFNLDGALDILDHTLKLSSDHYTPVDAELIPSGEIRAVAGTPFDFRSTRPIRHPRADGMPFRYDHNFVLRAPDATSILHHAATLTSPRNRLELQVHTSAPGLQVYDGHQLAVAVEGLAPERYRANGGICLEAQLFPDSPNRPNFPTSTLMPGKTYHQRTEYRFAIRGESDEYRRTPDGL